MLLDELGHINKKVKIQNSGYEEEEIALGFELWASVRYCFLSTPASDPELPIAEVEPYGLFIDEGVGQTVARAARSRFGKMYLGCIH